MAGEWHYDRVDAKSGKLIERVTVPFTSDQCTVDQQVLEAFGTLEVLASQNKLTKGHNQAEFITLAVDDLPKERKDHWLSELVRIGAIDKPKAQAAPAAKIPDTK